jgi:predicted ribonuclease YlaK
METRSLVAFVDTMVFLQYQPINQIPWPEVLNASSVTIAIAPSVVRELDRHKDSGTKRLRDRARRALKLIQEGNSGVELRSGVRIRCLFYAPRIDFAANGLDPAFNDDQLLAAVLDYRNANPDTSIALISHDICRHRVNLAQIHRVKMAHSGC